MPGVKAILTADDIPAPADSMDDNGRVIKASKWGERALTNEPMYMGDPILAVCAVDELTCAEAIEKIKIDFEELPFVVDPLESLRPGGPNPHEDGNVWIRPEPPESADSAVDGSEVDRRRILRITTRAGCRWDTCRTVGVRRLDAGFKNAALILDETFITPDVSHQCLEPRTAMAYWQNGKLFLHSGTQSTTRPGRQLRSG